MRIAVLTFAGFNELDSFIASAMPNRVKQPELKALIVCPTDRVASMNGVLHYVAPVNQKLEYVERARAAIGQYL